MPKRKYIFCNRCGNETNHECYSEHFRDYPNIIETYELTERLGSRYWICLGCESGTLEEYYVFDHNSEETDEEQASYHPERSEFHVKAKSFNVLPQKLKTIYTETLRAFNNKLEILCALGIRSLIEGICADKGIEGKNLEVRIDNMVKILPENIVSNLHSLRFIGNEAAHELESPPVEELKIAIELCEDILNYLYELDYKARQLTVKHETKRKSKSPGSDKDETEGDDVDEIPPF